jgi:mono/diheme cytochrome c family protein
MRTRCSPSCAACRRWTRPNRPHALRFPYDTQLALAVWRALYFRPGRFEPQAAQSADWNRGAYLVQGLGHCSACHAGRNALGAMRDPAALAGGLIPLQNWYAPGLAGQPALAVASLLQRGVSDGAALLGPMAEVVLHSTQHLRPADLLAMALHLQSLPQAESPPARADTPTAAQLQRGASIYETRCAACHGDDGQGRERAYVPLAGSRAVQRDPPANLVQVVLGGAFPASTAGNPRPFGMPPFATELSDEDVASVLSYIRNAWGNRAAPVQPLDVQRWRSSVRP